jgi:hypothetical protein
MTRRLSEYQGGTSPGRRLLSHFRGTAGAKAQPPAGEADQPERSLAGQVLMRGPLIRRSPQEPRTATKLRYPQSVDRSFHRTDGDGVAGA